MKKYKLIKEYPGSPELGIVAEERHVMKDQPEFWEEVIEKDYEILEYSTNETLTSKQILTKDMEGWNKIIENTTFKIHSVKRLSDGEVFTVGDRVKVYEHGSVKTITEIDINDTTSLLKEGIWLRYDSGSSHMAHAIKQKSPIFLTHDGKDIFAGDKVWYIHKEDFYYGYIVAFSGVKFNSEMRAYFLTREEASDYIEKSKVLFTTEDGVDIKRGYSYYFVDTNLKISLAPNASAGCGLYDERKYFSTFETAQYYVIVNAKVLSIEEFWEFISKPGSNIVKQKALKRLVKERLGL